MKSDWTHHVNDEQGFIEPLTRREREILNFLNSDLTHKEIADQLMLAPSSVKWYVQQVYSKLGVNSRRAAILRARQLGWLEKLEQPTRPSGYVTFLFTDIEGSTRLWETVPQAMEQSFKKQEAIVRQVFTNHGGYAYKMVGDAFQVAFASSSQAVEAAIDAQRRISNEAWGEAPVRIRMALHTCFTEERGDDYLGPELNRIARLLSCGHGGQVLMTQAVSEALGSHYPEGVTLLDLGKHRLKDIIEPEHIFQLLAEGLPADFPALKTQELRRHNLRPQLVPFVGREQEVTEIVNTMAPSRKDVRLLTLTGPGGVGKTRAALQAASALVEHYSDGVFFVELASVVSLPGMLEAISHALNLQLVNSGKGLFSKDSIKVQLLNFFSRKEILLVLDNFEHLVQHSSLLSDCLDTALDLKLIVTSRERLNLVGEWVYPLEGLPYPHLFTENSFHKYPSVQLFLDCAKMAGVTNLQEKDLPEVARICNLVEGLPLAIQLAASWVRLYSLQEIAGEINQNLDFLQYNQRGIPGRHQTIRAVFENSWDLLSSAESDAFKRLSVFEGGFTLSEALAVTGSSNLVISSLMDKSLIRRQASGRFAIHEILQGYALEKLKQYQATFSETLERHAACFAEWVEQMGIKMRGPEQATVKSALRVESRNLRRAWNWLVEHERYETIRGMIDSIILLFDIFGPLRYGAEYITPLVERLRKRKEQDENFLYDDLLALSLIGYIYFQPHAFQEIDVYFKDSYTLAQNLPTSPIKAYTYLLLMSRPGAYLHLVGGVEFSDYEKLMLLSEETLEIFQKSNDQWGVALTLLIRGDWMNGNQQAPELVETVFQQSLSLFKAMGNRWGQALCHHGMAIAFFRNGRYREAIEVNQTAMEIYEHYENNDRLVPVRHLSAEAAESIGEFELARKYYTANRDYFAHTGNHEAKQFYQDRLDRIA